MMHGQTNINLNHVRLFPHAYCTLCDNREGTERQHLLRRTALSVTSESRRRWEAKVECVSDAVNILSVELINK